MGNEKGGVQSVFKAGEVMQCLVDFKLRPRLLFDYRPNNLIQRNVTYFFGPKGAMKKKND